MLRFDPLTEVDQIIFEKICEHQRLRHQSVLFVQDISGFNEEEEDLLTKHFKVDKIRVVEWNSKQDQSDKYFSSTSNINKIGGCVLTAFVNNSKIPNTFIFIRSGGEYLNSVPILLQEMGHVDDIEKGKTMVIDQEVDLVASEVYANMYALREMLKYNLRRPMLYLMCQILAHLTKDKDCVQKDVAQIMVELPEWKHFRSAVKSMEKELGSSLEKLLKDHF